MEALYNKFKLSRTDGKDIEPEAQFFILRIDKKKHTAEREALRHFASFIERESPEFADELRGWVEEIEEQLNESRDFTDNRKNTFSCNDCDWVGLKSAAVCLKHWPNNPLCPKCRETTEAIE